MFQHSRMLLILSFALAALPLCGATLPAGTKLVVRLDRDVEPADKNNHKFSAELANPVFVDGQQLVPVGTRVEGEIRGSKKSIFLSPRTLVLPDGRKVDFYATVGAIDSKHLKADEKEGTVEQKGGDRGAAAQQAGEVGSTGAIIGAMSTGTVEGAAIGAAAGVGAVLIGRKIAGRNHSPAIPAGTRLTLNLNKSIDLPDSVADSKAPEIRPANREDRRPTLRRSDAPAAPSDAAPETTTVGAENPNDQTPNLKP